MRPTITTALVILAFCLTTLTSAATATNATATADAQAQPGTPGLLQAAQALTDTATLVRNTEHCGGGTPCEAIFTITAARQKTLARDADTIISFEDEQQTVLQHVPFSYDFEIGTMQDVTYTVPDWSTCTNTTTPNGTIICTAVNKTVSRQEIVYHGKTLQEGTNYVRVWSNDKPADLWVAWQVLMTGVPLSVQGVEHSAIFDTHSKGWAVWGTGPGVSSTLLSNLRYYFRFEDITATGIARNERPYGNGTYSALVANNNASGKLGAAWCGDAPGHYVLVSDSPDMNCGTSGRLCSWSVWWKQEGTLRFGRLWDKEVMYTTAENPQNNGINNDLGGDLNGGGLTKTTVTIGDNAWHLWTETYDGTTYRQYKDGVSVSNQTYTGVIADNGYPLCLGTNRGAGSCDGTQRISGCIDEYMFFYDYALTPADIS